MSECEKIGTALSFSVIEQIDGPLCRARRSFSTESILNTYKSTILPCIKYWCHICTGAVAIDLDIPDKIQKWICNLFNPD